MSGAQKRRGENRPSPDRSSAGSSSGRHLTTSTPITSLSQYDGNRDEGSKAVIPINKNIDMSVTMWNHVNAEPVAIQKRPAPIKLGREVQVKLNTWDVSKLPTAPIYQYDVLVGKGDENRGLIRKVLSSKALLQGLPNGHRWIFDSNKLAWSVENADRELRISVDLDAEQNRQPNPKKPNVHYVIIKKSTTIKFDTLTAYLEGKGDFDQKGLETINFLDHLLRQGPSKNLTAIKRNFFQNGGGQRFQLGGGLEAAKGLYQSMRIVHAANGRHKLSVNADVANCAFWIPGPLSNLAAALLNCRGEADIARMAFGPAAAFRLRLLKRVHVEAKHRGEIDYYTIDRFTDIPASQQKIPDGDHKGQTVAEYFRRKYNITLRHPEWPLVKMTKGKNTVVPLEVLSVGHNERFAGKIDERQTANMIKMAVTLPAQRWGDIQNGLSMVNWARDPYLNGYGLQISTEPVVAKGRLLPNPKIMYANGPVDPKTFGRWRVDGRKFLTPNKLPLSSWGVCVVPDNHVRAQKPDKATIDKFVNEFIKIYTGHGGKVEVKTPFMYLSPPNSEPQDIVKNAYQGTGMHFKKDPQLIFFVLPSKDAMLYGRIKKNTECRFGVPSQCVQFANVQKAQAQYISNVCLKVHMKLGGTIARAAGPVTGKGDTSIFKVPTMIVGADVTHPPPMSQGIPIDEQTGSIAAITCSMDKAGIRYVADTQTNGWRVEMIQTDNFTKLWKPMLQRWMTQVGGGQFPKHIYYFRDGVSEGQFASVLNQEVRDMKAIIKTVNPKADVKFVVIIATKRHHVRMFPNPQDQSSSDKNGNPLPGTVIETAVTHPYENDWFMCNHVALKGTARPTHYHCLVNEPGISNEDLMTLIYEHSYQFGRATTPVSLFPACYYADIAALRGKFHDSKFGSNPVGQSHPARGREESSRPTGSASPARAGSPSRTKTGSSNSAPSTVPELMPLKTAVLAETMWWV
ncbi:Piwi domain-containing protein [Elsinoe ampelina]|uniref:Piwi domain-containing protein n=1 Tax=Elsinoe ampelina TaxID=302913 RepID=A0A6A6G2R3_9PEZI|nr:Piwi domain-containing protein [Elsinoe ampelina]